MPTLPWDMLFLLSERTAKTDRVFEGSIFVKILIPDLQSYILEQLLERDELNTQKGVLSLTWGVSQISANRTSLNLKLAEDAHTDSYI